MGKTRTLFSGDPKMPIHSISRFEETAPGEPTRTPAVQRCCEARDRSLQESRARNVDNYDTRRFAAEAFCAAMPDLSGYENIRDFIACASYGMVNGLIDVIEGSKFLYAAQVAIGVLRYEPKDQNRTAA
jgi:hypothetical protein